MKMNHFTMLVIISVTSMHLLLLTLMVTLTYQAAITPPNFNTIEFVNLEDSLESNTQKASPVKNIASETPSLHTEQKQQHHTQPDKQEPQKHLTNAPEITSAKTNSTVAHTTEAATPAAAAAAAAAAENNKQKTNTPETENKEAGIQTNPGKDSQAKTNNTASDRSNAGPITAPTHIGGHLDNPKPPYPELSRKQAEEGSVQLQARVEPNGRASSVKVLKSSGFPRLDKSARMAITKWRFNPAKQNGEPIAFTYVFSVNFSLKDANK